jgi:hypothetical protein
VSAHRESFAHRARNLLPLRAIWDFPIPNCSDCGEQMVKLEGQWGCRQCTGITILKHALVPNTEGELVVRLVPTEVPLIEAYPNRAARRSVRR